MNRPPRQPSAAAALRRWDRAHRSCTRCMEAGYLDQANPVFSGEVGQRILLVGQAPGPVEHDANRPFAGRAGRQLMRWLVRAGFADEQDVRSRAYMTSMTTCFPGRTHDNRGDRRPGAREIALCAPWLDGVLELLQPRLILPVGSLALARFLPGRSLDDSVGRCFGAAGEADPLRLEPPVLVPLPHPSGQSRWLNDPERLGRLDEALQRLGGLVAWADAA